MKEQIKPLIKIEALDGSMGVIFEYECSFHHIRSKIRGPNTPIERDIETKEQEDRIIRGNSLSDKSVIENAIHLAKRHIIHNYLTISDDRSINENDNIMEKIESGKINWKIKKYFFDRSTRIGDIVFEGYEMPFTDGHFTYLGKEKIYEVMGHTVHIGKLNEHKHLQTLEVEWRSSEAVGRLIDRAREQHKSHS